MSQLFFQALGKRMREIRLRAGMSIREAAQRSGVDKNTVLRIEAGKPVRDQTIQRMCQTYGFIPFVPAKAGVSKVGIGYAMHRKEGERWTQLALENLDSPSRTSHSKAFGSEAVRLQRGRSGTANQFMRRLECRMPGGRMVGAVFEVFGSSGWASQPYGEAFVYALRGDIRFWVGAEEFVLEEGTAATFDRTIHHMHEPASPVGTGLPPLLLYVQSD